MRITTTVIEVLRNFSDCGNGVAYGGDRFVIWIAAAAVTRGLALATLNVREFGRVSGLAVEEWGD